MRLVRRPGGGILLAASVAIAMLVACATGTDSGSGAADPGDGGAPDGDAARDVYVVPAPKDSAVPDDAAVDDSGEDSGNTTGCTKKIVINELKTAGASSPDDEMVELYNPNTCSVPLGSWTIKYQSASGSGSPSTRATFATGDAISAKSYLVLTPTSSSAKLAAGMAADNGQIGLLNDTGGVVDAVAYGTVTGGTYREGTAAPSPPPGGSIGRSPNGVDTNDNSVDFKAYATPSQNVANP